MNITGNLWTAIKDTSEEAGQQLFGGGGAFTSGKGTSSNWHKITLTTSRVSEFNYINFDASKGWTGEKTTYTIGNYFFLVNFLKY